MCVCVCARMRVYMRACVANDEALAVQRYIIHASNNRFLLSQILIKLVIAITTECLKLPRVKFF